MPPTVSVVIPTHNNAGLIHETLDSVLAQSFKDFEVIVIDDGSTDDTQHVVRQYETAVRYVSQNNADPAAARNHGVSLSTGQYIAFCDHDDIWLEHHLEQLLQGLSQHSNLAMCFDNAESFGAPEIEGKVHLDRKLRDYLHNREIPAADFLELSPILSFSNVLVRKDVFKELGGLSSDVGVIDDFHFYLRCAATKAVRYVDHIGIKKRVHENSLCLSANLKEVNVLYLEDIRRNHPEVVAAIGDQRFRKRLARKYFKLGRHYLDDEREQSAAQMFWLAHEYYPLNLRYLMHYLFKTW